MRSQRADRCSGRGRTLAWRLLVKAHALQKIGKAGIASQRVEPGIHPDRGHSIRTVAMGPFKPGKGLFLLSQHGI
jgi:hypothetical protein